MTNRLRVVCMLAVLIGLAGLAPAAHVGRAHQGRHRPEGRGRPGYQNVKKNTPNTARIEHDKALQRVMVSLLKDDTELYKQFVQNESFRRFVTDMVFTLTSA